ncbi:MCE family protein [Phytohabitans flavus]|uniref:MCE family protein n=1 Tax=Phytohabitans flavus TaxID=1076124 RepID=UPI003630F155
MTARLLPKTLFGERYVALVAPPGASGQPIRDGAVITQDRSRNGVELERVLDEALPLLQSIRPDRLATVLGALAAALDGRGEQLGRNLVLTGGYLGQLNKEMPVIAEDVRKLSTVVDAYDAALPDLLSILRDVTVTAGTVVDQRAELSAFLASATGSADTTRLFLDRHDDQLIRLGDVSRPVLELLAAYAPEYPCLMRGLVALQPRVEESFSGGSSTSRWRSRRTAASTSAAGTSPPTGPATVHSVTGCPTPRCRRPASRSTTATTTAPTAPRRSCRSACPPRHRRRPARDLRTSPPTWARPVPPRNVSWSNPSSARSPASCPWRCPTSPYCCGGRCCAERW